ncbi:hypothetical protein Prudu_022818, partial [Prunus dulcis]
PAGHRPSPIGRPDPTLLSLQIPKFIRQNKIPKPNPQNDVVAPTTGAAMTPLSSWSILEVQVQTGKSTARFSYHQSQFVQDKVKKHWFFSLEKLHLFYFPDI